MANPQEVSALTKAFTGFFFLQSFLLLNWKSLSMKIVLYYNAYQFSRNKLSIFIKITTFLFLIYICGCDFQKCWQDWVWMRKRWYQSWQNGIRSKYNHTEKTAQNSSKKMSVNSRGVTSNTSLNSDKISSVLRYQVINSSDQFLLFLFSVLILGYIYTHEGFCGAPNNASMGKRCSIV